MPHSLKLMMLAGAIFALPGCQTAQTAASSTWPGTWPPPASMNCPRNNQVPFSGPGGVGTLNDLIGPHLTNLHASPACVPQPACAGQRAQEQKPLAPPVWVGPSNQVFTIGQQDTMFVNARNAAMAQAPAGKQLYRITFAGSVVVGSPSTRAIIATGHYGQCITRIRSDGTPREQG